MKKAFFIVSLLVGLQSIFSAQDEVKIMLHGQIIDKAKAPVQDATIEVFKSDLLVNTSKTDEEGNYNFVPAGIGTFRMIVSKEGHTKKTFVIDQSCPEVFDGDLLEYSLNLELQKLSKTVPTEYPPATIYDCHK